MNEVLRRIDCWGAGIRLGGFYASLLVMADGCASSLGAYLRLLAVPQRQLICRQLISVVGSKIERGDEVGCDAMRGWRLPLSYLEATLVWLQMLVW